jgi:LysM repeat protein
MLKKGPKGKPGKKAAKKVVKRTIKKITVDLSTQKVTIVFDQAIHKPKTFTVSSGKGLKRSFQVANPATDRCKNPGGNGSNCTPTGNFKIGRKAGRGYKSGKGDKMAYYVEINGTGATNRGIGFHNSQIVNGRPMSHGCIRVSMSVAKLINQGVHGKTQVKIDGKANIRADRLARKAEARRKASRIAREKRNKGRKGSSKARTYVIQSGDSIGKIARKFKVSPRDLMKANGIKEKDKNNIRAGDSLKIPSR